MRVYLDNNTTTMVDPKVLSTMTPYFSEKYGLVHASHQYGKEVATALRMAQEQLYTGLNAHDGDDIYITTGTTHANNWVFSSVYENDIKEGDKDHIITTEFEDASVLAYCKYLESQGVKVSYLPINAQGMLQTQLLSGLITERTALVSVSWVNPVSGIIAPVSEIAQVASDAGALFHIDATHAVGKVRTDLQMVPAHFVSFSAHTFHGPKGIGGLFVKYGTPLCTFLHGEDQFANPAGVIAMGEAYKRANLSLLFDADDVAELRDELEDALTQIEGVSVIGFGDFRTVDSLLISVKGVTAKALAWDLNQAGVAVFSETKTLATALGLEDTLSHCVLGFTLSRFSTEEEIAYTIEAVKNAVTRLRTISSMKG